MQHARCVLQLSDDTTQSAWCVLLFRPMPCVQHQCFKSSWGPLLHVNNNSNNNKKGTSAGWEVLESCSRVKVTSGGWQLAQHNGKGITNMKITVICSFCWRIMMKESWYATRCSSWITPQWVSALKNSNSAATCHHLVWIWNTLRVHYNDFKVL